MPLESIVQKTSKISLSRIGWGSFFGGVLGGFYEPRPYLAFGGAFIGFSLTLCDELRTKRNRMDLAYPFWGAAIGGFIGGLLNNEYKYNYIEYAGLVAGGTLGLLKAYSNSILSYKKKKKELISPT